jgi:integrase
VTAKTERRCRKVKSPQAIEPEVSEFLAGLKANGISSGTIENYVWAIRNLRSFTDKPFADLTKEDLLKWCAELDNNGFAEGTAINYKVMVKSFLRWVHTGKHEGDYPPVVAWIKAWRKNNSLPKQILTRDEIRRMLDACESQRDRAMLYVGYELGARPGELRGMKIGDVEFDKFGAVARISGKTGERRVRLIESVPDLKLWLSMHPLRENPEAPLWWNRNRRGLSPMGWYKILKKIARKAGVNKHVHPHLLRHSRATHLANILTEAQMREYFGWTKSSDMPEIYVHLSGRDVDDTLFKHYGIKVEAATEELLAPKQCPWCQSVNSPSARFCQSCNSPLDPASVSEAMMKEKLKTEFERKIAKEMIRRHPDEWAELLRETKKELEQLA